MSTGSTEPRAIFALVNDQLGLGLDNALGKPDLARAIVEASGEQVESRLRVAWRDRHEVGPSRGPTSGPLLPRRPLDPMGRDFRRTTFQESR